MSSFFPTEFLPDNDRSSGLCQLRVLLAAGAPPSPAIHAKSQNQIFRSNGLLASAPHLRVNCDRTSAQKPGFSPQYRADNPQSRKKPGFLIRSA